MDIPVVNVTTGKAEVIDSTKILFVQADGMTYIHTRDHVYKPANALKDYAEILLPIGFEYLDKSNVVNINLIRNYDKIAKQAYFDKERIGKSVKVSRRNRRKLND
ncbi:LytTR family DNA-binding domain-containing protein [Paenibacillus sp. FSL E2-0274]|uniref:LytTR family DNA-binding domain-containing protein n=1 Tax=Paenibacillus TaxID=44249 RepID=UPI00096C1DA4|nr:LytTR family DNA-binding domain-containing protein [Paenibacillus odorifer]OMD20499.1 hypothetical protein BJP48_31365 [Paenibacillus odorifer]OME29390.1 hypothetical protein BSK63_21815 [Paenibacillus odorifer]